MGLSTNPSALLVPPPQAAGTALATNDIRAIRPPLPLGADWHWWWWAILVLVLLGAVGLWLWLRHRRSISPPPVPRTPPHLRAQQALLKALSLLADPEAFCVLVSDTLRYYLEERFDLHAPERTTEEFLLELQTTGVLTPEQKASLVDFLQRCDLVKFAAHEPPEVELRQLLEAASRLIDETKYENPLAATDSGATLAGTTSNTPEPTAS